MYPHPPPPVYTHTHSIPTAQKTVEKAPITQHIGSYKVESPLRYRVDSPNTGIGYRVESPVRGSRLVQKVRVESPVIPVKHHVTSYVVEHQPPALIAPPSHTICYDGVYPPTRIGTYSQANSVGLQSTDIRQPSSLSQYYQPGFQNGQQQVVQGQAGQQMSAGVQLSQQGMFGSQHILSRPQQFVQPGGGANFQQQGQQQVFQQGGGNFQQGGGNFQQQGQQQVFQQGGANFQQGGANFQQGGANFQQGGNQQQVFQQGGSQQQQQFVQQQQFQQGGKQGANNNGQADEQQYFGQASSILKNGARGGAARQVFSEQTNVGSMYNQQETLRGGQQVGFENINNKIYEDQQYSGTTQKSKGGRAHADDYDEYSAEGLLASNKRFGGAGGAGNGRKVYVDGEDGGRIRKPMDSEHEQKIQRLKNEKTKRELHV